MKKRNCLAVVRIRGIIRAPRQIKETLQMLHLKRNNYAVLIDDRPSFTGMLKKAQNFITWGEASKDIVTTMMYKRGRLVGNKKLTDAHAQNMGYNSLEDLAEVVFNCGVEYRTIPNVQPFFKLHPPTKGFKRTIKKSYGAGGELGYRKEKINELLKKMV